MRTRIGPPSSRRSGRSMPRCVKGRVEDSAGTSSTGEDQKVPSKSAVGIPAKIRRSSGRCCVHSSSHCRIDGASPGLETSMAASMPDTCTAASRTSAATAVGESSQTCMDGSPWSRRKAAIVIRSRSSRATQPSSAIGCSPALPSAHSTATGRRCTATIEALRNEREANTTRSISSSTHSSASAGCPSSGASCTSTLDATPVIAARTASSEYEGGATTRRCSSAGATRRSTAMAGAESFSDRRRRARVGTSCVAATLVRDRQLDSLEAARRRV